MDPAAAATTGVGNAGAIDAVVSIGIEDVIEGNELNPCGGMNIVVAGITSGAFTEADANGWDGETEDDGVALDIFDAGWALLKKTFQRRKFLSMSKSAYEDGAELSVDPDGR